MARSKWDTNVKDKLVLVEGWARNGLTEQQIAKNLGVAYSTFRDYKTKYPALSAVLKKGREVIDFEVEGALIKRALGYSYVEETKELVEDEMTGSAELKVIKTITKHVAPDVTAQIFWLKNRKPEEWKNDPHKVKIDKEILKLRQQELELKGW
ncbi:transposase [Romboutsia ilealis]|uniref:transposase n=1 Tax=Romboutsia ilealis TaxID=1115758 RepID=UPI0023F580E9|nr:transposase [Romboutsia ilealis]